MYKRIYVYKGIKIELYNDGRYITNYTLSNEGKIYEKNTLEHVTLDLLEPLLSDIYYDIDNGI